MLAQIQQMTEALDRVSPQQVRKYTLWVTEWCPPDSWHVMDTRQMPAIDGLPEDTLLAIVTPRLAMELRQQLKANWHGPLNVDIDRELAYGLITHAAQQTSGAAATWGWRLPQESHDGHSPE